MSNKTVFTLEEAKEKGIEWEHWRNPVIRKDTFVKSDDDIVMKVINYYILTNSRGYISHVGRTALGMFNQEYNKHFYVKDLVKKRHNMGNQRRDNALLTVLEKKVLDLWLDGMDPLAAVSKIFDTKYPKKKLQKILRRPKAIKYMSEKLRASFEKIGINEDWFAEKLKEMVEDDGSRLGERLEALKYAAKMSGQETPKIKGRETIKGVLSITPDEVKMLESTKTKTVSVG